MAAHRHGHGTAWGTEMSARLQFDSGLEGECRHFAHTYRLPDSRRAYDAGMPGRADDSPQIIPYLYYEDATKALDFLVDAYGFEVKSAMRDDNGDVLTAQLRTGDGVVMIGPGMDGFGTRGIQDPDWATSRMFVYVVDVDAHYKRARSAGARIVSGPAVHFSDNKVYVTADSGGQQWIFAEPVPPEGEGR
jgi:uncharacterized glyoxalase superfamily protein PhnB